MRHLPWAWEEARPTPLWYPQEDKRKTRGKALIFLYNLHGLLYSFYNKNNQLKSFTYVINFRLSSDLFHQKRLKSKYSVL